MVNRFNTPASGIYLAALGLLLSACAGSSASKPAAVPRKPAAAPVAASAKQGRPEFPGFRRVVRNDTEYFCQASTPTGSRTRRGDQCFTRDELKRMEETNRDVFKDAAGGSSHDTLKMDPAR